MVVVPETNGNGGGITGAFDLTAGDVAGLKHLVNGQEVPGDDDTVPGVRDLSGHGNNVTHPDYGAADEHFIRLTEARYGDYDAATGNNQINPIFDGLDPRNISNILGVQEADLPKNGNDANIFFMAFGQYFDHGLDFLPKGGNGTIQIGPPATARPDPATLPISPGHGRRNRRWRSPAYQPDLALRGPEPGLWLERARRPVPPGRRRHGGLGSMLLAGGPDPSDPNFRCCRRCAN